MLGFATITSQYSIKSKSWARHNKYLDDPQSNTCKYYFLTLEVGIQQSTLSHRCTACIVVQCPYKHGNMFDFTIKLIYV